MKTAKRAGHVVGRGRDSARGAGSAVQPVKLVLRLHPDVHAAAAAAAEPSLNAWINRVLAERLGISEFELPDRRGRPPSK